jgi:hypothetical protein
LCQLATPRSRLASGLVRQFAVVKNGADRRLLGVVLAASAISGAEGCDELGAGSATINNLACSLHIEAQRLQWRRQRENLNMFRSNLVAALLLGGVACVACGGSNPPAADPSGSTTPAGSTPAENSGGDNPPTGPNTESGSTPGAAAAPGGTGVGTGPGATSGSGQ